MYVHWALYWNIWILYILNRFFLLSLSIDFIYIYIYWISPACQSFAAKVACSVSHCYHAVKARSIFTTKMAFNSIHKDVLPILKRSLLIYKFNCRCNSAYIGRTRRRLEVRIRQHALRGISNRGRLTSGQSQAMDSAIGEHLFAIIVAGPIIKMTVFLFYIELGIKSN